MNYSVILLAAGSGKRMNLGYNKILYTIDSKPIFILSSSVFFNDRNCKQLIYVTSENDLDIIEEQLNKHGLYDHRTFITIGGQERQESVYNGLKIVKEPVVLVHDTARPFISQALIDTLLLQIKDYGCCIPGVKVKDTIKKVENNLVTETIPRELLYAIQTPQATKTDVLIAAHELAKKQQFIGTDCSSLIEQFTSTNIKVVEGNYDNMKVTSQEDLTHCLDLYHKYYVGE